MRTAIGLMREGETGIRRLEATIGEASAAEQAAARMAGFGGMVKELRSVIEGLAISIGDTLLPALTDLGKTVAPIIRAISRKVAGNPGLTACIIGATGAGLALRNPWAPPCRVDGRGRYLRTMAAGMSLIGPAAAGISAAARESMRLNQALAGMAGTRVGTLSQMGAAFRGIAGVTGLAAVATGISAIAAAVAAISAPVCLAIAGAVAAVGLAWRHWDRVSAIAGAWAVR